MVTIVQADAHSVCVAGQQGRVRQNFSHGRSKTVVVETKRKRIIGTPGAKSAAIEPVVAEVKPAAKPAVVAQAPVQKQPVVSAASPAPASPAPEPKPAAAAKVEAKAPVRETPKRSAPKTVGRPKVLRTLTAEEAEARERALVEARQRDIEDKKRAEQEAVERVEREAREAAELVEKQAEEARRTAKRAADAEARSRLKKSRPARQPLQLEAPKPKAPLEVPPSRRWMAPTNLRCRPNRAMMQIVVVAS